MKTDVRNVQREGEAFRYTAGVFAEPNGADPRPLFDAANIRGICLSTAPAHRAARSPEAAACAVMPVALHMS